LCAESQAARSHAPAEQSHTTSSQRIALRSGRAIAVFVVLTGLALAADLVCKSIAFDSLLNDPQLREHLVRTRLEMQHHRGRDLTPDETLYLFARDVGLGVKLHLSTNPGIVFGMRVNPYVVGLATVATVALLVYVFAVSRARDLPVHIATALIVAGALGNLHDRLFGKVVLPTGQVIRHQVRDFIDCSALHYPWIFNVADAWLVVGVVILGLRWIVHSPASKMSSH